VRSARTWLIATALVALGALATAAAAAARRFDAPFGGFLVYRSGAITSLWRGGWPGPAAGLRVRDVVLAVDGEPVRGGAELNAALAGRAGAARVTLTVRQARDGARREVAVPLRRLDGADLGFTLYLPFTIGLLYLLLGAVVLALKPSREASLASALFFVAAAFYLTMFDAHTSYRFTRVWLLYPLFGPLSIHLFAVFPEVRPGWARARVLGPLYLVGAAVIAWRQLAIDDPIASDRASLVSSTMLLGAFAADLGLLGYTLAHAASRAVRNRAKTVLAGLALTCTASVAWQFASRLGPPGAPMTADQVMVLSALFPFLAAYAIVKRNLLDLDAVLRAGLIYGLATAFVVGLYFAAVAAVGHLAAVWAGPSSTSVTVAATLLVAVVFHPVRLYAQRIVDRVLYRGARPLADLLALLRALSAVEGVGALADGALGPLRRLAGAPAAFLWVRRPSGDLFELAGVDGEKPGARPRTLPGDDAAAERAAAASETDLVVPLRARGVLVGLLVLTRPRAGATGYAQLRAVEAAAPQLALALENAQLVSERAQRERLAGLGQMAAVIVHEVKNPLGIIRVAAGTLKQRARDDASIELAACVEDEVDRVDATVRRLLELARPPQPRFADCDLERMIEQTLDRLRPDLQAAGVIVRTELAAVRARVDADELRRALLNLLLNARAAMPDGGTLAVRLRPPPPAATGPGRSVEIDVEDSGVGMDEATRRQLFRPFFTTRHGGTGLGLAFVKRVVEDHRGAIRVESQPGRGSLFTVTIPTA
jgi:signal transduction histidine kinase